MPCETFGPMGDDCYEAQMGVPSHNCLSLLGCLQVPVHLNNKAVVPCQRPEETIPRVRDLRL